MFVQFLLEAAVFEPEKCKQLLELLCFVFQASGSPICVLVSLIRLALHLTLR